MSELVSRVMLVGEIDGSVERKSINSKDLAEFRLVGLALRITAWQTLAHDVPDSGRVIVEGRLNSRDYQTKEGQDRTTTEIIASTVMALDAAAPRPEDADLPF